MEKQTASDPIGKCPHCRESVVPDVKGIQRGKGESRVYATSAIVCPSCETILGAAEVADPIEQTN